MWQEIIVGAIVLGAVLFLVRRWLPFGKKSSGSCGSCGGCSTVSSAAKSCSNPEEKGTH
jgi:fluoride ion exporter CrcB/FEX